MSTLAHQVLMHAATLPEGGTLTARALLHLGSRAAVDQVLSRLTRRGELLRVERGVYVLPVKSSFGTRAPQASRVVRHWASERGEIVASHGAAAANAMGLTTQVPVRQVFLTSGRNRTLRLGGQTVELRHAPPWQLVHPERAAGEAIRSLAWAGPSGAREALSRLCKTLPAAELQALVATRARMPTWLAGELGTLVARA